MGVHGPRAVQHRPCRPAVRHICADLRALPVTYRTTTVPRGYPRAAGGSSLGDSSTAAVCRRHRFGAPIRQRDCNRHGQGSCRKVCHRQRPCTGCPCGPRGIDVESNVCCAGLGSARTSTDVSSATSADVRSATFTAVRSALLAERLYATRRSCGRSASKLIRFESAPTPQSPMVATQADRNSRARWLRDRGSDRRSDCRDDVVHESREHPLG